MFLKYFSISKTLKKITFSCFVLLSAILPFSVLAAQEKCEKGLLALVQIFELTGQRFSRESLKNPAEEIGFSQTLSNIDPLNLDKHFPIRETSGKGAGMIYVKGISGDSPDALKAEFLIDTLTHDILSARLNQTLDQEDSIYGKVQISWTQRFTGVENSILNGEKVVSKQDSDSAARSISVPDLHAYFKADETKIYESLSNITEPETLKALSDFLLSDQSASIPQLKTILFEALMQDSSQLSMLSVVRTHEGLIVRDLEQNLIYRIGYRNVPSEGMSLSLSIKAAETSTKDWHSELTVVFVNTDFNRVEELFENQYRIATEKADSEFMKHFFKDGHYTVVDTNEGSTQLNFEVLRFEGSERGDFHFFMPNIIPAFLTIGAYKKEIIEVVIRVRYEDDSPAIMQFIMDDFSVLTVFVMNETLNFGPLKQKATRYRVVFKKDFWPAENRDAPTGYSLN